MDKRLVPGDRLLRRPDGFPRGAARRRPGSSSVKRPTPARLRVYVDEWAEGWKQGDQIIVTSTTPPSATVGASDGDFLAGRPDRGAADHRPRRAGTSRADMPSRLDRAAGLLPLRRGEFPGRGREPEPQRRGRVGRSQRVRGHTMYHRNSAGSISYAEFRHLGKRGRARAATASTSTWAARPCGAARSSAPRSGTVTTAGSRSTAPTPWSSATTWATRASATAIFLEDGTEVNNILDHNLAALVLPGKPQKEQEVPVRPQPGGRVLVGQLPEQLHAERGRRVRRVRLPIRHARRQTTSTRSSRSASPTATLKPQDTRILPFVRFEDNEAHTMKFFCLNLRGMTRPDRGLDFYSQNESLAREAAEAMPEPGHPFWIRDFRGWEANWATHLGTTGVFIDGLDVVPLGCGDLAFDHGRLRVPPDDHQGHARQRHPQSPQLGLCPLERTRKPMRRRLPGRFQLPGRHATDDRHHQRRPRRPPGRRQGLHGRRERRPTRHGQRQTRSLDARRAYAEWEIALDAPAASRSRSAHRSEDVHGHVEPSPHVVVVD